MNIYDEADMENLTSVGSENHKIIECKKCKGEIEEDDGYRLMGDFHCIDCIFYYAEVGYDKVNQDQNE